MVKFELNIAALKEEKTYEFEVEESQANVPLGKRVRDVLDRVLLGLKWKKIVITGGVDG